MSGLGRLRARTWFHRHVAPLPVLAIFAFVLGLVFAISLPLTWGYKQNQVSDHRRLASERLGGAIAFVDQQFTRMFGVMEIAKGFVASAAPLQVPDYQTQNASQRAAVALRPGTPNAFTDAAYQRVQQIVKRSFVGYSNVIVQPGGVNVYAEDGSPADGLDWLAVPSVRPAYDFMVNTTRDTIRYPTAARTTLENSTDPFVIVRSPIFNRTYGLSTDKDDVDPRTGRHVNWNYLWGAIVISINMQTIAEDPRLSAPLGSEYHWLFESLPVVTNDGLTAFGRVDLASSADLSFFSGKTLERECSQTQSLTTICISALPVSGDWNGHDITASLVKLIVADFIVCAVIAVAIIGAARLLVGPKYDPLRYAPTKTPLHAVCVDLPDANRMWGEVPFIMHEVTTTFGTHVDALAAQHRVYVTMRLGCTAVAVTNSRKRALAFARGVAEWGCTFTWPPHIIVHCPRGQIRFTAILHSCENVTVRIDREQDQCDVTGPDIKALLLLRVAAVEQHVMCTGEFIGMPAICPAPPGGVTANIIIENNRVPTATSGMSEESVREMANLIGPVGELGVCDLPLPNGTGPVTSLRGFLLHSHSTNDREINAVLDEFPDSTWSEWRSAKAHDDTQRASRNPLMESPHAFGDRGAAERTAAERSGANSSRTALMTAALPTRQVTQAHLNNGDADTYLPGCAVERVEARKLAQALVAILGRSETDAAVGTATLKSFNTQAAIAEETFKRAQARLQSTLSIATYFLMAYRIVFAPLEPEVRQAVVARICAGVGVAADDYSNTLAVRCTQMSRRYIDDRMYSQTA